jgi:type I restriction enzyme S subunit
MKQGWEIKKLDDLCSIELGKTPYRGDKSFWDVEKETSNVWLSIADMLNTDGDVVSESKEYITDKAVKVSKVVKKGTLLLSFKLTLGRLAFAGKDLFTNEAIAAIQIKNEKVLDKYFLYHFFSFFDWDSASEGDVKVKGKTLNKSKLKEIEVHYPNSLAEQKRIVSILDTAFEAIDKAKINAEQNLKNSKELFESYLQNIFSSKGSALSLSKGEGWEEKTLSQISNVFGRGKSKHRPRNFEGLYGGEYPFIQTGDIRNCDHYITDYSQTYNEMGLAQSKLWPSGTICITIAANIAETGVLTFDACFPDSVIGLVVNESLADRNFVEYLLQSFKSKLQALGKGSAQANLNMGSFENEVFPFPSVEQQRIIVKQLDDLSKETKRLEAIYQQKLIDLEELKKSLLEKAFKGELKMENAINIL